MSYSVLVVDDDKVDAKLMKVHLERSEYDFAQISTVHSRDGYLNELMNSSYDLIISDYRMKEFNGLEAIRLKKRYAKKTPLIIVSGTIGDENAVELIKKGAIDFLLKDSAIKRLAQVSIRAIQEAEEIKKREEAETTLNKALNRYKMLFESSRDGIIFGIPDDEGVIIEANKAICDLLGYTPEEMKNLKRADFVVLDAARNKSLISEREDKGEVTVEMLFRHKSGKEIPVEVTSSIIETEAGIKRSFSIVRDIRERKEVERKLDKNRRSQELQKNIVEIINQNIEFEEAVKLCLRFVNNFVGWSVAHVYFRESSEPNNVYVPFDIWDFKTKGVNGLIKATQEKYFPEGEGMIGSVALKKEPLFFDLFDEQENYLRYEEAVSAGISKGLMVPIVVDGQTEAIFEFYNKKGEQVNKEVIEILKTVAEQIARLIERKQFIDALQDEKKFSEKIINSLPGIFFIISEDLKMVRFNMQLEGILDYTHEEVLEMHPLDFVVEEDRNKAAENIQQAFETGEVETELRMVARDGQVFPFLMSGIVTVLRGKKCLLGTGINIEERLKVEDELREEKDFIERAINSLPGLFYVLDEDGNYERVNQNFIDDLGYTREELDEMNPLDFYLEKDHERMLRAIEKAFTEGDATLVSQVKTKDGELPWYYLTGRYFSKNGKNFILGTGIDISEQKELEYLLEEAHEIASIGGWEVDMVNDEIHWTKVTKEIHEVEPDYEPDLETAINFYKGEEQRELINKSIEEAIKNGTGWDFEAKIVTAKGNEKWIRAIGHSEFRDGECVRLYGSFQDIHDSKTIQERLKTAQRIANLGYWTYDLQKDRPDWSEESYRIWEQDPEEFYPSFENILQTIHLDDRELLTKDVEKIFPEDSYGDYSHRIITPSGNVKWIHSRVKLKRDREGKPKMLMGTAQDVTEQKEREEQLRNALNDKEVLMMEVHHRVKNNLALISGILQLQALQAEDTAVYEQLANSETRIQSIAIIHELLYQTKSFSEINLKKDVSKLIDHISQTFQSDTEIEYNLDMDDVILNVNQAIPCALILNEVLTNIYKHAFTGRDKGTISVELGEHEEEVFILITDDGNGLPDHFRLEEQGSLGYKLINTLNTQLDGQISLSSENGRTRFELRFKIKERRGAGSHFLN